jgi:hypothetical protein
MKFGFDKDDSIEQLLDYVVFAFGEGIADGLEFYFSFFVNRRLGIGGRASSLSNHYEITRVNFGGWRRTEDSKALNSASLAFLYSSISFEASERASLSFCILSAKE